MAGEQTSTDDFDEAALATPKIVLVAGRTLLATGVFTTLLGVQSVVNLRIEGPAGFAPPLTVVVGIAASAVGLSLSRARGWAAPAAVALSAGISFTSSVWLLWTVANGYLAPLSLLVPPLAYAATVLALIALGPARKAADARRRAAEAGIDLGI